MLKKVTILAAMFAITFASANTPSNAGLDAQIDLTNPRIVPMYVSDQSTPPNNADEASYSGFLYSSRIVFSAAHSEYYFDNSGKIINRAPKEIFVGKPNSRAGDLGGSVRVIKRIVSTNYRFDNATLGDFVVYILEKDLIDLGEVKLLTKEIAKELIESRIPITMHGYGEYTDRCISGEKLPCTKKAKKTEYPRSISSRLMTLEEVESIVGYKRPQLSTSLITNNGKQGFGCGGDSGGSVTAKYKGELLYLSTTPNGMNGYACGATGFDDGKGGFNYASPVYDHLDVISEAKKFLDELLAAELKQKELEKAKAEAEAKAKAEAEAKKPLKSSITCVKGKTKKKVTSINPKCPKGYTKVKG
jgi:hypothetical protein